MRRPPAPIMGTCLWDCGRPPNARVKPHAQTRRRRRRSRRRCSNAHTFISALLQRMYSLCSSTLFLPRWIHINVYYIYIVCNLVGIERGLLDLLCMSLRYLIATKVEPRLAEKIGDLPLLALACCVFCLV
jgi:hypothetical protein